MKTLIVYFSCYGSTEKFAKEIAEVTHGDLFRLEHKIAYDSNIDHYEELANKAKEERDRGILPDIKTIPDVSSYDYIFIGYPMWWGVAAWSVNTFVEANDFTGKTVIPFCTSASSGLGESGELLANLAKTGNWLEGHRFSSNPTVSDITTWTNSLK